CAYSLSLLLLVSRFFFFSSRRRHTRFKCDWSSDVCSSDLTAQVLRHGVTPAQRRRCHPKLRVRARAHPSIGSHSARVLRPLGIRSEERRVGKECRSEWSRDRYKKEQNIRSY